MMKNIRKILALVLSLALVLALVACGGKAPEAGAQAGAEAPAAGEEAGETTYPVVKIVFTATQEPTETAEIEAFVNERLRERYGVEVSFTYIPFGDLQTSVNLMLTGGDEVDLFTNRFMGGMTLSSMSANGQIIPLNDLLEQYGQGIMGSAAADYLDCVSIDGKIWGVPSMGAFAAGNLYLTRKDVADAVLAELGWTMEDVCDYETLTTYMIKAKEMFPEYYYVPGSTAAGAWYVGTNTGHIDNLGVGGFLAVLDDPTNSTTVVNYYASEDYYNACVWAKQWKDAGLILPDPMNAAEALKAQLQKGQLGGTHSGNYSAAADAASYSSSFGFDCVAFTLGEPLAITSYVSGNAWCISSTCKNPEAAMKVLNALYCDADIATAVMNGLEGLDYVVTENGTFGKDNVSGDILITSIGQSADVSMLDALMKKVGATYTFNATAPADEVANYGTVILASGASSKGLGAAGISQEDELARAQAIVDTCKEKGIVVIMAHLGGSARRGALSDQFNDMALTCANYILVVEEGNDDGKFTDAAADKGIPVTLVNSIADTLTPLTDIFG